MNKTPLSQQSPQVSVIIVNWNTRDYLDACLGSLFKESSGITLEVIVVDNGSRDGSQELVTEKYPGAVLLKNDTNLGFVKANIQGYHRATGKYVLLLNSDTVILEQAVTKTFQWAEAHPETGIIGCRVVFPDMRHQNSIFRFPGLAGVLLTSLYLSQLFPDNRFFNLNRYGNADRYITQPRQVECVCGCFMFMKRSDLKEIGFFDPRIFMYAEETDLCYRFKKAGKPVYFYPDARIIHIGGGSAKSYKGAAFATTGVRRGTLYFLWKWSPLRAWFANLIYFIFLFPRILLWLALDLRLALKQKASFKPCHLQKTFVFKYHLLYLFFPWQMKKYKPYRIK